ncbi:MAG: hypothetical protein ACAH80_16275 [Alphaproteobacteria bacterium]
MSFYIELKNWNDNGPKTFLVQSFNAASKCVKEPKGMFGSAEYGPDPGTTRVVLDAGGFRDGGVWVEIPVGYEAFKKELLDAKAANTIPSFSYSKKYVFGG